MVSICCRKWCYIDLAHIIYSRRARLWPLRKSFHRLLYAFFFALLSNNLLVLSISLSFFLVLLPNHGNFLHDFLLPCYYRYCHCDCGKCRKVQPKMARVLHHGYLTICFPIFSICYTPAKWMMIQDLSQGCKTSHMTTLLLRDTFQFEFELILTAVVRDWVKGLGRICEMETFWRLAKIVATTAVSKVISLSLMLLSW